MFLSLEFDVSKCKLDSPNAKSRQQTSSPRKNIVRNADVRNICLESRLKSLLPSISNFQNCFHLFKYDKFDNKVDFPGVLWTTQISKHTQISVPDIMVKNRNCCKSWLKSLRIIYSNTVFGQKVEDSQLQPVCRKLSKHVSRQLKYCWFGLSTVLTCWYSGNDIGLGIWSSWFNSHCLQEFFFFFFLFFFIF